MLFCVITDVEFRGWEWSGKRCYDHLSGLLLCSLRLITTGWSLLHIFPSWLRPIINNADCVIFWVDRLGDICSSWEQRQTPLETSLVTIAADGSVEVTLSPWKRPPCVCWDILYQGRRSDLKPQRITSLLFTITALKSTGVKWTFCNAGASLASQSSAATLISERANREINKRQRIQQTAHNTTFGWVGR